MRNVRAKQLASRRGCAPHRFIHAWRQKMRIAPNRRTASNTVNAHRARASASLLAMRIAHRCAKARTGVWHGTEYVCAIRRKPLAVCKLANAVLMRKAGVRRIPSKAVSNRWRVVAMDFAACRKRKIGALQVATSIARSPKYARPRAVVRFAMGVVLG